MEHPVSNIYITADSIISGLGFSTEENIRAIQEYRSGIQTIDDPHVYAIPFKGARIDSNRLQAAIPEKGLEKYTRLEQLFILTISEVIRKSGFDPTDPECILILSTTKGNIDCLEKDLFSDETLLSTLAEKVAEYFGFIRTPIVISSACISGVTALIAASRLIRGGECRHALVAGGDLLTRFVVTGFQSFKSVSPEICRPYDSTRDGLSLGEACGAVLITADKQLVLEKRPVVIEAGCISNDANHISGPSRTGDGLFFALSGAMKEAGITPDEISFVNAHGTGTVYNDEMESKAMRWAGLDGKPVNSLKPYWGHTLGASGILETIACLEQLRNNEVFGTPGFENMGVSCPLLVSSSHQHIPMKRCIKTASGFGGCNAAIILTLEEYANPVRSLPTIQTHIQRRCSIKAGQIIINGQIVFNAGQPDDFPAFIRAAYKHLALDDRKFYKMDDLSKLGYIAATYLLAENPPGQISQPKEIAIFLANAFSSLDTDRKHQQTIDTPGDPEASPAIFVYTLPNVVMGEICIRHKIQGDNTFFISRDYDEAFLRRYAELSMQAQNLRHCIIGWCDYTENSYEAHLSWIE